MAPEGRLSLLVTRIYRHYIMKINFYFTLAYYLISSNSHSYTITATGKKNYVFSDSWHWYYLTIYLLIYLLLQYLYLFMHERTRMNQVRRCRAGHSRGVLFAQLIPDFHPPSASHLVPGAPRTLFPGCKTFL